MIDGKTTIKGKNTVEWIEINSKVSEKVYHQTIQSFIYIFSQMFQTNKNVLRCNLHGDIRWRKLEKLSDSQRVINEESIINSKFLWPIDHQVD